MQIWRVAMTQICRSLLGLRCAIEMMTVPEPLRVNNSKTPEVTYNAAGLVACRSVLLKDAVFVKEAVKRLRNCTCLMSYTLPYLGLSYFIWFSFFFSIRWFNFLHDISELCYFGIILLYSTWEIYPSYLDSWLCCFTWSRRCWRLIIHTQCLLYLTVASKPLGWYTSGGAGRHQGTQILFSVAMSLFLLSFPRQNKVWTKWGYGHTCPQFCENNPVKIYE